MEHKQLTEPERAGRARDRRHDGAAQHAGEGLLMLEDRDLQARACPG